MRKMPSDEDWRRYDKEAFETEYGDAGTNKWMAKRRWITIGFVLVIVMIFIVAILASRS
jgi:hypothetical protein